MKTIRINSYISTEIEFYYIKILVQDGYLTLEQYKHALNLLYKPCYKVAISEFDNYIQELGFKHGLDNFRERMK